jgi:spermidine/putrescine transport system permease protein
VSVAVDQPPRAAPRPAAAAPAPARRLRRPSTLAVFVWLYIAWSLLPALIAMGFSFNAGRSRSIWQGFSFRWWVEGPGSLLHSDVYGHALEQSFKLAALNIAVAVPLGVGLAIVLSRWFGRGSGALSLVATLPLVIPELLLAISLFLLLTELMTFVDLGTQTQAIGQITFTLPFVIVITRGRLASISTDLEEAAMDLGASPLQAMRLVLLPLLQPAILASVIIAFALSIDDFVVTQYLASDASTQTVPMLIYNTARGSATPALNATATLLVVFTALMVGLGALLYKALARRQQLDMADAE